MSHLHSAVPDPRRIEEAAISLQRSTKLLDHERDAVKDSQLFNDNEWGLFVLLGQIDIINSRLHKQLIDWHTQFPQRPSLHESDKFWTELKALRQAKEQLAAAQKAIKEHEEQINTLAVQIQRAKESVDSVERYFDGYLNRVNERE